MGKKKVKFKIYFDEETKKYAVKSIYPNKTELYHIPQFKKFDDAEKFKFNKREEYERNSGMLREVM